MHSHYAGQGNPPSSILLQSIVMFIYTYYFIFIHMSRRFQILDNKQLSGLVSLFRPLNTMYPVLIIQCYLFSSINSVLLIQRYPFSTVHTK